MSQIVLASQSPQRRDILTKMGVDFIAVPSNFDERLDDNRPAEEVAIELALGKANDVAQHYQESYVIGSDTIITIDGKQLAKPENAAQAQAMLKSLAGKVNYVTTSVAVINRAKGVRLTGTDTAKVYFKPYDEQIVAAYVATGDSLNKAGGYGIQSGGAVLIDHIEGEYDTIVGLPSRLLVKLLAQVGIKAKPAQLDLPVLLQLHHDNNIPR